MSVTLHQGSILDSTADIIVNPANCFLMHGGGLARVIADAATRPFDPRDYPDASLRDLKIHARNVADDIAEWHETHAPIQRVATGDAVITSSGRLPQVAVVHAVGPIWAGGMFFERNLLASAHSRAIKLAQENRCESIAFPAISSGIFGMPIAEVAQVAVRQAAWHDFEVEFWLFSDEDYAAFEIALMEVPHI